MLVTYDLPEEDDPNDWDPTAEEDSYENRDLNVEKIEEKLDLFSFTLEENLSRFHPKFRNSLTRNDAFSRLKVHLRSKKTKKFK